MFTANKKFQLFEEIYFVYSFLLDLPLHSSSFARPSHDNDDYSSVRNWQKFSLNMFTHKMRSSELMSFIFVAVLGSNFDLIFKRQNSSDMVILSDGESVPTLDSFTIALFVRADSKYKSGTLFSYSVPKEPNETIILSYTKSQVEIKIKDETIRVNFELADDRWHYVAVVWDGMTGLVSVYIDGPEIEKKVNVLTGDAISGGGWIVLGQRYLAGENRSLLSTAFVGTLHQVNFWNAPGVPAHMTILAYNCTWPVAGTTLGWTSFLFGIKGNVEKRFMTQCKGIWE